MTVEQLASGSEEAGKRLGLRAVEEFKGIPPVEKNPQHSGRAFFPGGKEYYPDPLVNYGLPLVRDPQHPPIAAEDEKTAPASDGQPICIRRVG